jgi:hypothetical protein
LLSITKEKEQQEGLVTLQKPLYSFMYALKSSEARRQYPKRLKMLFDYLKLQGPLEEQAQRFLDNTQSKGIQPFKLLLLLLFRFYFFVYFIYFIKTMTY